MASVTSEVKMIETQKQSALTGLFNLLPDDLLMHIISFLPTKDAVFTSILSQRWKFLWCYAGNSLEFDDEGVRYQRSVFPNFVDSVLRLYKAPLLKFTLLCHGRINYGLHYCHKLWIDHALRQRKATELEIYFDKCMDDVIILPIKVFNSETLQVLKLECSSRILSTSSLHLNLCIPNLKVLCIWVYNLHWSPLLFSHFFSAAPRLEEACLGATMSCSVEQGYDFSYYLQSPSLKRLRLSLQTGEISAGDFIIDAPVLEEFFVDDDCFRHYVLKGMSSLVTAKVNVGVPFFRKIEHAPTYFDHVDELLRRLANTKSLYLRGSTMDVLSAAGDHNLRKFSNLSHLHIRVLNYFSWDALPTLLQNAPNLKILVLKKDFKDWYAKFKEDFTWCKPQQVPVCLSKTLLELEIWGCEARPVELDLVSYLLRNGKVLNTFMVDLLPHSSEVQSEFCKRIMMIPKGSVTCQIKISTVTSCPALSSHCTEKALELLPIPQRLTYKDLNLFTDGFDSKNLISITPLSKLYRAKMPHHGSDSKVKLVTVKEWMIADRDLERKYNDYVNDPWFPHRDLEGKYGDIFLRCFHDEVKLLQHPNFCSNPYFLRLLGYSMEDDTQRFSVVYDFEPLDVLESLIAKDNFNWLQRIKVALGLACILEYMHKKTETLPAVVHNLDAAHVMLDQDHNPVLLDFSCVSGGIFPERDAWGEWLNFCRCIGWTHERDKEYISDKYERYDDIFAYGIILLGLISKRVYERDSDKREAKKDLGIYGWAEKEYRPRHLDSVFHQPKISLVHRALKAHPTFDFDDGLKVTSIAMRCVGPGCQRPRMKGVVNCLLKLHIIKQHWDYLECDKMLNYIDVEFPSYI